MKPLTMRTFSRRNGPEILGYRTNKHVSCLARRRGAETFVCMCTCTVIVHTATTTDMVPVIHIVTCMTQTLHS